MSYHQASIGKVCVSDAKGTGQDKGQGVRYRKMYAGCVHTGISRRILQKGEGKVRYSDDTSGFVRLSNVIPDALQEIRYHSTYNFIGDRIDGYDDPIAFLTREAAQHLKGASDAFAAMGYRIKIWDTYRPQMAVDHFMRWAEDIADTRMKPYFYANLDKSVLIPEGYIARHSGHTRGSTVDLTLLDMRTGCEVDMGGAFDDFSERSHPDFRRISQQQYAHRMLLRDTMMHHGFRPITSEWWHFTLADEPWPDTYFTFPIRADILS